MSTGFISLAALILRRLIISSTEFPILPGPKARALRAKTIRQVSFSGSGGQAVLSLRTEVFRCRGARPGTPGARLILRKHGGICEWISSPADAFCAQRPCFRATSLLFHFLPPLLEGPLPGLRFSVRIQKIVPTLV
jgi:hypothetical protein